MSEENLWGELPIKSKIETPISILKKQAAVLNQLTNGYLDGRIVSSKHDEYLVHEFRIVVPVLGNYSVTIFHLRHELWLYPAEVQSAQSQGFAATPEDSAALKNCLRELFQSDEVKRTINVLYSQATDEEVF